MPFAPATTRHRFLRFDRKPIEITREGYWIVRGTATTSGVFEYRNADGSIRREYRPPDEVRDPTSVASLVHQPITIQHEGGEIGPDNINVHRCGTVTKAWAETLPDGRVAVMFEARIETQRGQDAIASGLWFLSSAYHFGQIERQGGITPDGTAFDLLGRGIVYNHLTLTDSPRVGEDAQIRFDTAGAGWLETREIRSMFTTVKFQGRTYRKVGPLTIAALRQAHETTKGMRSDQVDVRRIAFEDEPGNMTELVVAAPMIDEIMRLLGAAGEGGQPPAEPDADPMPVEDADPPTGAPGQPPREDGDDPRMDSRALERMIERSVARAVGKQLGSAQRRFEQQAAERRELERRAGSVLGPRFDFAGKDSPTVMRAVISKIRGAEHAEVETSRALADTWRSDSLAEGPRFKALGRLEAMFEAALADHKPAGSAQGSVELVKTMRSDARDKAAQARAEAERRRAEAGRNRSGQGQGRGRDRNAEGPRLDSLADHRQAMIDRKLGRSTTAA